MWRQSESIRFSSSARSSATTRGFSRWKRGKNVWWQLTYSERCWDIEFVCCVGESKVLFLVVLLRLSELLLLLGRVKVILRRVLLSDGESIADFCFKVVVRFFDRLSHIAHFFQIQYPHTFESTVQRLLTDRYKD
jgi:hypothetical protein